MIRMFGYTRDTSNDTFNDIIDEIVEFTNAKVTGRSIENFSARLSTLNNSIAKYCLTDSRWESQFETKGASLLRDPNVNKNRRVRENFEAIITQMVTATAPVTSSERYKNYLAEVRQIGWGDTARFQIKSNALFKVNEIAKGVRRGILQPIYNDEVTVETGPIEIATAADWYSIAAGVFDWGDFAYKIALSFDGYIMLKIIAAMTSATEAMGSAYSAAGIDATNWITLKEKVSAANGGAVPFTIGTALTLNKIAPTQEGYQHAIGAEMVKIGYLDKYLGANLIPLDQFMIPGTLNSTADLAIPNDIIFVIASTDKPVKIVYEGSSVVINEDAAASTDKMYAFGIQMNVGVSAIVGSKFGTIDISDSSGE